MKERPILFSTPMILALLDGRKSMTRRIVSKSGWLEQFSKVDLERDVEVAMEPDDKIKLLKGLCASFDGGEWVVKSKWEVGDILWVRETFSDPQLYDGHEPDFVYRADGEIQQHGHGKWKPSIFMPKEACRIRLEIIGIKVERVQDISEVDARREGIYKEHEGFNNWYKNYLFDIKKQNTPAMFKSDPIASFKSLWQSINGVESWESNPFVWCISFKIIKK